MNPMSISCFNNCYELHFTYNSNVFPAVQVTPAMIIVFNFDSLGLRGLIMALYLNINILHIEIFLKPQQCRVYRKALEDV